MSVCTPTTTPLTVEPSAAPSPGVRCVPAAGGGGGGGGDDVPAASGGATGADGADGADGAVTPEDPGVGAICVPDRGSARRPGADAGARPPLARPVEAATRARARSLPPGAAGATRAFSATDGLAASISGTAGPATSCPSDPSPPSPPDPSAITSRAATSATGTIAAAVPARRSWRNHAPTRSMLR